MAVRITPLSRSMRMCERWLIENRPGYEYEFQEYYELPEEIISKYCVFRSFLYEQDHEYLVFCYSLRYKTLKVYSSVHLKNYLK